MIEDILERYLFRDELDLASSEMGRRWTILLLLSGISVFIRQILCITPDEPEFRRRFLPKGEKIRYQVGRVPRWRLSHGVPVGVVRGANSATVCPYLNWIVSFSLRHVGCDDKSTFLCGIRCFRDLGSRGKRIAACTVLRLLAKIPEATIRNERQLLADVGPFPLERARATLHFALPSLSRRLSDWRLEHAESFERTSVKLWRTFVPQRLVRTRQVLSWEVDSYCCLLYFI